MTLARISLAYLRRHKLGTALNVALLAFGVAAVTLLLLTSVQLEERVRRDTSGVDLIVGARGSHVQIVLSSLYDLDVPTGSIPWATAQEISSHAGVKAAIPVSLGDNYFGFRIVGTTAQYLAHYGARLSEGHLWKAPLQAVLGSDVAARMRPPLGSTFVPVHGLSGEVGEPHAEVAFRVVGVLDRTGTLVDQQVLTDLASYWEIHPEPSAAAETGLVPEPPRQDERTVTAVLVKYASAAAATDVRAFVRSRPNLEAASPAREAARLFGVVALSLDLLRGFAIVLLLAAALSIFVALYHGLNERRYDLAVMRALGATRRNLMALLLFEGVLLAAAGAIAGVVLGHLLTSLLGFAMRRAQQMSVTGWIWDPAELWVVLLAVAIGAVAALLPAWRAHEVDIAATLARG